MPLKTYTFEVPGKPFGKQRPRVMRNGHTYTPSETVNYENLVKVCFREKYPEHTPTEGIMQLIVDAYFPIPDSWSKKKKQKALDGLIRPHKPDWDNIGKIISDALNEIAYKDDSQIYLASVRKEYSERPRVEVFLHELVTTDEFGKNNHADELPF